MFILDFGSGNTCRNDLGIIKDMINSLAEIDTKRKIIIKWQLFEKAGNNIPLERGCFSFAKGIADGLGFRTTASVFDLKSLTYLLNFDIPFVKIANRPDLYWLIGEVPRRIPVVVSVGNSYHANQFSETPFLDYLCCISSYPTVILDYEIVFPKKDLKNSISDHTTDWKLFLKYRPGNYECHFCLTHDSNNPDGGLFARTPKMISEIYEEI